MRLLAESGHYPAVCRLLKQRLPWHSHNKTLMQVNDKVIEPFFSIKGVGYQDIKRTELLLDSQSNSHGPFFISFSLTFQFLQLHACRDPSILRARRDLQAAEQPQGRYSGIVVSLYPSGPSKHCAKSREMLTRRCWTTWHWGTLILVLIARPTIVRR